MKKLILVTLTALAASWLLAEARRTQVPDPPPPVVVVSPVYKIDRPPFGRAEVVKAVSRRKGDGSRSNQPPQPPSPKPAPPAWFPKTELDEKAMTKVDAFGSQVIVGRVSSSEDRARQDLRVAVERAVGKWLGADVPASWKVPAPVLGSLVQDSYTQEVTRNLIVPEAGSATTETAGLDGLYTLYRAGQKLDFSSARKAQIVEMYRRDLATQRMQKLGGGLALALVTLALLSGYIKTDEATKGYYTNRLRFLAAAGLGGAGVVVYRLLA